jgi:ABC-type bacteriocin/lantibiotic exporter with double-glycine peptidase domain
MPQLEVPYFAQEYSYSCGSACLRMALAFAGIQAAEADLIDACGTTALGTPLGQLWQAAVSYGAGARLVRHFDRSNVEASLDLARPVIALVDAGFLRADVPGFAHGVVLLGCDEHEVVFHDPQAGPHRVLRWHAF